MRWLRRTGRSSQARRPSVTSLRGVDAELRLHLPLLWPSGPDGPVDEDELRTLARLYARSGRPVDDLLGDLDRLCDVIGVPTSSAVVESSTIAWSDAFLDESASSDEFSDAYELEPYDEVGRSLAAHYSNAWTDLPEARLVFVVLSPTAGAPPPLESLRLVAARVRAVFPSAAVTPQPALARVVACVSDTPDLPRRLRALDADLAEHLLRAPVLSVRPLPAAHDSAVALLRTAG